MKPILLTVTLCLMLGQSALLRAESPAGTLVGRITYAGPIESGQVVAVTRDSSFCGATTAIHTVTVNAKTRGLQGAVVSIDGDTVPMADSPRRPLVLTNTHCAFSLVLSQVRLDSNWRSATTTPSCITPTFPWGREPL